MIVHLHEDTVMFAAGQVAHAIVHIVGLLASHQDVAATISRFTDAFPVAATLYDLIPHVDPAHYLTDSTITAWYRDKLDHLARATLLLAISESTRREAWSISPSGRSRS
jgi:hypothetical protein